MSKKSDFRFETRRSFLRKSAGSFAALSLPPLVHAVSSTGSGLNFSGGESVPPIGMGTWLTFDVPTSGAAFEIRRQVLEAFFTHGGGMIDSSPMYGNSEKVVGELLSAMSEQERKTFSATKIWTVLGARGPSQLDSSYALWQRKPLDLVHVHNLLRWKEHLKTLREAKEEGHVRYIGLTTSHGRRHDDMERLIRTEPVDCVQFTYNLVDREAENRLLPAALERGVAVVINRPFQGGGLFQKLSRHPLPPWAEDICCPDWATFFLKFIISHPAVTVAIPATTRVDHMKQNMRAARGEMPNPETRNKMVNYIRSL